MKSDCIPGNHKPLALGLIAASHQKKHSWEHHILCWWCHQFLLLANPFLLILGDAVTSLKGLNFVTMATHISKDSTVSMGIDLRKIIWVDSITPVTTYIMLVGSPCMFSLLHTYQLWPGYSHISWPILDAPLIYSNRFNYLDTQWWLLLWSIYCNGDYHRVIWVSM